MVLTNYSLFHADLYSRGLDYAIEHTLELGFDTVEFLGAVPKNNTILPDADAAVRVAEKLAAVTACVVGQRYRASRTGDDLAAILAAYLGGITAAVEEKYSLPLALVDLLE